MEGSGELEFGTVTSETVTEDMKLEASILD